MNSILTIPKRNAWTHTLLLLVLCLSIPMANAFIEISAKEEKCLEKTGRVFMDAGDDLIMARYEYTKGMDMKMTSKQKMTASYPEEKIKNYETYCKKYGGKMQLIKIDFFDCLLVGEEDDVELTIKNFANCLADVDECVDFSQEHLLQEAWKELGLTCELEEEETKKDDPDDDNVMSVDDDLAKKEKEAAAEGADDVDKEEKKPEYIPKEYAESSTKKAKRKHRFTKFVLFISVCGAGYYVFDRKRRGDPIELPYGLVSKIPFFGGGTSTSRFARRAQPGFVSDYNLLSAEENELQLSSNYP